MKYGDHVIHELAVKAGATYGQRVISARTEYTDFTMGNTWGMEVWTRFEVESDRGEPDVHYLSGSLEKSILELIEETTTIDAGF